jgi:16S rRNA (cytosine967-C5)-methyltransferase
MTVRANQLAGLAAAILRVQRLDAPADVALAAFFRAHPAIGQRDRAFVAEGTFAYLRRKRSLDALVANADSHRLAIAVAARELGHSARDLDAALAADDKAWLASLKSAARAPLPPAVAAELPDWLWNRLVDVYGETEAITLARAFQAPAAVDLRSIPSRPRGRRRFYAAA